MPFVTLPSGVWTAAVTTTEATAVQNRGGRTVYLTTLATGGLGLSEGLALGPNETVAVVTGKVVSLCSPTTEGSVFYVGI